MEKAGTGPGPSSRIEEPTTKSYDQSSIVIIGDTSRRSCDSPTRLDPIGTSQTDCFGGYLGKDGLFIRLNCKRWDCASCCKRKAKKLFARAKASGNYGRLNRLVTLPFKIGETRTWQEAIEQSGPTLNRFFALLRKRKISFAYFWVREIGRKNNMIHFHMLIDRYLPKALLSHLWAMAGGGSVVDIGIARGATAYLWKYLLKVADYQKEVQEALYRKRRYGTSRGLLAPLVRRLEPGWSYVCLFYAKRLEGRMRRIEIDGMAFYTLDDG